MEDYSDKEYEFGGLYYEAYLLYDENTPELFQYRLAWLFMLDVPYSSKCVVKHEAFIAEKCSMQDTIGFQFNLN